MRYIQSISVAYSGPGPLREPCSARSLCPEDPTSQSMPSSMHSTLQQAAQVVATAQPVNLLFRTPRPFSPLPSPLFSFRKHTAGRQIDADKQPPDLRERRAIALPREGSSSAGTAAAVAARPAACCLSKWKRGGPRGPNKLGRTWKSADDKLGSCRSRCWLQRVARW